MLLQSNLVESVYLMVRKGIRDMEKDIFKQRRQMLADIDLNNEL